MNYYHIACKYVTPIFRICYNYRVIGAENLRRAAQNGRVVVCTTHSSDLGGMIVGMAVSMILNTEPYVVVNSIFRKKHLTNFFLRKMNVVWIMGNDVLGNYPALKKIRDLLINGATKAIIIAPQGIYNRPDLRDVRFRQGFAIPCLQAAKAGTAVYVVPALDVGATYKGMPPPGRRIAAVFGHPMEVNRHTERTGLTRAVERSVRELMTAYVSLFGACFLFAYIYAHC
jgi:1-acyl-sn-glycerol-3-phosphate acyltransferase